MRDSINLHIRIRLISERAGLQGDLPESGFYADHIKNINIRNVRVLSVPNVHGKITGTQSTHGTCDFRRSQKIYRRIYESSIRNIKICKILLIKKLFGIYLIYKTLYF